MDPAWELTIGWVALSSLLGFAMMGVDKARARHGEWRISERTLLATAFIGGAFGIVIGSSLFHHKTSKKSFVAASLVAVMVWIAVILELQRTLVHVAG